jgi:diguanylate cyclase (GGDEF)-like protein
VSTSAYAARPRGERAFVPQLPERARGFLIAVLLAALCAAAASAFAAPGDVRWADFAALLGAGAVAQLFAAQTHSSQVFHTGLVFTVAAALVLPPQLVVVVVVGQHLPEWARQRYPWYIQSFNIANFVLGGLAAWAVRDAFAGHGFALAGGATSGMVAALCAGLAFIAVNHLLLARMLRLARGHELSETGLFSIDGLVTDLALAATGVAVAYAFLHAPALLAAIVLPLALIQRAVALPSLREQAIRDHKTGLLNSRGIDQPARNEFARARRLGRSMSVLLCDIDDLREINNRHGHLEGDAALVAVASAFRAELRPYDLCARFGGDEFLVVLPETDEGDAISVAARIQAWLALHPIPTREGRLVVAVSIGAASLEEDTQIGELMARADVAMYAAKRGDGRALLTVG